MYDFASGLSKKSLHMASAELLTFEDFYHQHKSTGKTQLARLLKLSATIEKWSQEKATSHAKEIKELTIRDVQTLRQLIENEVTLTNSDDPNIVTDQILFLIIGAVKVQAQSTSSTTWPLVNQTIKELVSPQAKQNNLVYFALFGFLLMLATALSTDNINKQAPTLAPIQIAQAIPVSQAGSETVGNLIKVYHNMKSGDCQLPQALLLQPKDREAFIAFVTEGKVTISTAESLKKSLEYADCKYPQKLMNNPLNRL